MKAVLFYLSLALLALTVSALKPIAPTQGSYTYELEVTDSDSYVGGRVTYDYIAGYYRSETYDSEARNPGINSISIYNLRLKKPTITTIDAEAKCYVQPVNEDDYPSNFEWESYTLAGTQFFNKHLTEKWTDGSDAVYVDLFNHDVVGMEFAGEDGVNILFRVTEWSDASPDGSSFLLPKNFQCKALNSSNTEVITEKRASNGVKCFTCEKGIGLLKGRVCSIAGAAACAPFPPAVPYCGVVASLLCGRIKAPVRAVCKAIKMCN